MSYLVVLTTTPKAPQARRIAGILLQKKLAACITIHGPVVSHYRWKGKLEKTREFMLLIKTRRVLFAKLEKTIRGIHPYEVPEILALPVAAGSKKYLEWIKGNVARR